MALLGVIRSSRTLIALARTPTHINNNLHRNVIRVSLRPASTQVDNPTTNEDIDSESFGKIELPVEEKIMFNKFEFEQDDNDEQDAHEAKVGDIYRPGKDKFLRKINYLVHKKRNLREALNVLETEMVEECVQPEQWHFRILIHACAKVGHAEKAFKLFTSMRKRQIKRHVGIYADLFHSCTNCPDKEFALSQAQWMRKYLAEQHFIPSKVVYHSMIQAFGRTGDLETAFELLDEMRQHQVPVTYETCDFILQGCIADRESGFRHALLTWRFMRRKQIWPRIYNYNLMLKAAQDCRIGDVRFSRDIILACLPMPEQEQILKRERKKEEKEARKAKFAAERGSTKPILEIVSNDENETNKEVALWTQMPNLLAKRPPVDANIIGLAPEDTPQSRLMLLGGLSGLVQQMKKDRVSPDIKTFDQLLRIIPNTTEAETDLLMLMKENNVVPDVSFCNQVIILREKRGDLEIAKHTLVWMSELELIPDVMTYGALARCCKDPASVNQFLRDCKELDVKLNVEILTTLVTNMAKQLEVEMVERLLAKSLSENITVNKRLLISVETFFQRYRKFVRMKEQGQFVPRKVDIDFRNHFDKWQSFVKYYNHWLKVVNPSLSDNPLDQYKTQKDVKDEAYNAKLIASKSK